MILAILSEPIRGFNETSGTKERSVSLELEGSDVETEVVYPDC